MWSDDELWQGIGRIRPKFAMNQPQLAWNRPTLAQLRSNLAGHDQIWTDSGQVWADSGQIWATGGGGARVISDGFLRHVAWRHRRHMHGRLRSVGVSGAASAPRRQSFAGLPRRRHNARTRSVRRRALILGAGGRRI